jgi:HEAT repeat protein
LSSRPIGEQVAACRVLAKVAPAAALARLMDIVAMTELDPEIARAAIWQMSRAIFEVNETNLAFDRQRALDVLRPRLTMGQTHQRKNVVDMLALVDLPQARDLLRGLLADPDIDLRLRVAERLASIRDAAGWPVLKEVLTNRSPAHDRQRHWAILALKDFIDLPDSSLREEVLALAASEVERLLERSDNGAANEVMNQLRVVEAAPPAWAGELLGRVAGSQMQTWVRDLAFQKQLELGGLAAVPAISKALQDNHHLFATLNALLKAGASAATPEIVRGVSQALDECNAGHQADLAYRALLAIGSGAQDVIERNRASSRPGSPSPLRYARADSAPKPCLACCGGSN